jgi:hypothetical protein
VTGDVNTHREGRYTVTYTVTDDNRNTVEAMREVVVFRPFTVPGVYGVTLEEHTDDRITTQAEHGYIPLFNVAGNGSTPWEAEFAVTVNFIEAYDGLQTLFMTHIRGGRQIGIATAKLNLDDTRVSMGFMVLPGDQVRVFVADDLGGQTLPVMLFPIS